MSECLFCRIINQEIKSDLVYEDELIIAIKDINPQAPVHLLIMPKKHIANLEDVQDEDIQLLGHLQARVREIAREAGLQGHYRLMSNCGAKAGQVVFHLHYHLMGGIEME